MYREFNNNPVARRAGDCAVRAVSLALDKDWQDAYAEIAAAGYLMGDMPSANWVWGSVLRKQGFSREVVPNTCPDCYTVQDFAADHPEGTFVLGLDGHVVTIINGDWFDSWNSKDEPVVYYWFKGKDEQK